MAACYGNFFSLKNPFISKKHFKVTIQVCHACCTCRRVKHRGKKATSWAAAGLTQDVRAEPVMNISTDSLKSYSSYHLLRSFTEKLNG